ncbi:MAG: HAMP domain-containing protein [Pseudomonadaceae bacterium]|nr:MAG: HAMP domain-containing protein [Pseudomonadaceae bacterium]
MRSSGKLMFRFRRLQQELTLSLIMLTLAILLALAVSGVWIILQSQQRVISSTQEQVAQRVSQEVGYLFSMSASDVRLMQKLTGFDQRPLVEQQQLLFDFVHGQESFDYLTLYRASGELEYKVHRQFPREQIVLPQAEHRDALSHVIATGENFYGGLSYDPLSGEPRVLVAFPVVSLEYGRIDQVLIGSLRFRALWQIMAREARGSGREVFLVADDDRVIAHPNPTMVLSRRAFTREQAVAGIGLAGASAIVAEAPLQFGALNYRVVAEQPAVNIFRGAMSHALILLLALVFAFAAAVVLGFWLSRRITQPLDQLVAGAQQIASGDMDTQITVSGRNELALLGQQFNNMCQQLRDLINQLRDNAKALKLEIASRRSAELSLKELNHELEQRVEQRTRQLSESLRNLEMTQASLVQSEKLAGLGALVAGIAHELNTPIGNARMMASTLQARSVELTEKAQQGLRRSDLDSYLALVAEGCQILESSLSQSSRLIASFKQVAVDQTSYQRRSFSLAEVVDEIILSMAPAIRRQGLRVHRQLDNDIQMDSYPGPIGQILLNLINNAMVHAFDGESGDVWIEATTEGGRLLLSLKDNGKGIPEDNLGKIFDPFFTSRLGQGGSGLGLNIVYNLINGLLGGEIEVSSETGQFTCFTLRIPLVAPATSSVSDVV